MDKTVAGALSYILRPTGIEMLEESICIDSAVVLFAGPPTIRPIGLDEVVRAGKPGVN